jgi:TatD DNase family protein
MQLTDTHCHVHESNYSIPSHEVLKRANDAGVTRLLCVGTSIESSKEAIAFAKTHGRAWASIGLHPHDADLGDTTLSELAKLVNKPKVVAVGECGLDYYYNHSPKENQAHALHYQIELAIEHNLPVIFHVRDAFKDFWPIFDSYKGIKGELHSFTDTRANLDKALERDLYIGLNGIMTFTKDPAQLDVAKAIPLEKLLLETDAPYLTPAPHRGTVNEPARVRTIAEFLATQRGETLEALAAQTTDNARVLFNL